MTGRSPRRRWAWAVPLASVLPLAPARAAELPHCYVGARPCGTAEQLARTLARCLGGTANCGVLERGGGPSPAATGAAPAPPPPPTPGADPARRVASHPASADRPPGTARASGGRASGTADPAPAAVEALARALPLDAATRDLADALPADAAAVERRLGLRRPSPDAAVADLRGPVVPSADAILRALLPR